MSLAVANRPLPSGGATAGGDDLDDLDNYDFDAPDDPFSANFKPKNTAKDTTKDTGSESKDDSGLGLDKEVEVTKKARAPRVKLDEHRYGAALSFYIYTF
jgi:replication fork protection complex subunit Csm3/Swi3